MSSTKQNEKHTGSEVSRRVSSATEQHAPLSTDSLVAELDTFNNSSYGNGLFRTEYSDIFERRAKAANLLRSGLREMKNISTVKPHSMVMKKEAAPWLVMANSGMPNFPQYICNGIHVGDNTEYCIFEDVSTDFAPNRNSEIYLPTCRDVVAQLYQVCYALRQYNIYTNKIHFKVIEIRQTARPIERKMIHYKVSKTLYFSVPYSLLVVVSLKTQMYTIDPHIPDIAFHDTVKNSLKDVLSIDQLFPSLFRNKLIPGIFTNLYETTVLETILLLLVNYFTMHNVDMMIPVASRTRASFEDVIPGELYIYNKQLFVCIAVSPFGQDFSAEAIGYSLSIVKTPAKQEPQVKISTKTKCPVNDLYVVPPLMMIAPT